MSSTFSAAERTLFTSESVTEGHPDKLCDQVSDAVLDAVLTSDPRGRVACETGATTGLVVVFGEITTDTYIEIPDIVRGVIKDIGYDDANYGFDYQTCGVMTSIKAQSPEIAGGVDAAFEIRNRTDGIDQYDRIGAGDQGMMIGYACNETPELMPLPIALAHKVSQRLATCRKDGSIPWLRPDGKSQITVEYRRGKPARIEAVVVSTQHADSVSNAEIDAVVRDLVIEREIPGDLLDRDTKFFVNPSGRFTMGGPLADAGLTGRKIIVDTYGGMARHGGGAFSGKDSTKVDRSGAYAARYVAKNVVAAGLADRFEIQISYAIGVAHPVSLMVETFGTGRVSDETIEALVLEHFDLRPLAIIEHLELQRPIYRQTAAYGHFGRPDLDLPWERLDKADQLASAVGVQLAASS